MDFPIWVPPENQDFTDESSYRTNGWEYNIYFDPRLDVIEEDALNEKSCKEVLKILTNGADSEIVDLEDDILMVQNQLACEVYKDSAALNEKNVNLESMVRPSQNENQQPAEPGVGSSNLPEGLNKTVKFRDGCTVQANNTVFASLVEVENQQETTAEPGVGSSNLPEGLEKTKAIDDHNSKDIRTVTFKDGCTVQANNTVLASLVEVENQQETPTGTTLEDDRHASKQEIKFRDGCTAQANKTVLASLVEVENQHETPAGTTLEDNRHASEQEINEYRSKSTQNEVKSVQINDPSGMKGQEAMPNETDRTIKDAGPHLPNSVRNDKGTPDSYEDKTIKETQQQLSGAKRTGDSADISATSLSRLRRRSKRNCTAPVVQENNDQKNVDVASSESSITPVPQVAPPPSSLAYIDNMSLVQLKALAYQNNIHGVSKIRKADLQQILRSKLQHKIRS